MTWLVTLGLELPPTSIEWRANACPGAEIELERAIAEQLRDGGEGFVEVDASLELVEAGPVGLQLALELRSAIGHEHHALATTDCDRAIEQAALLIASAIDPFAFAWPRASTVAEQHHRPPELQRPRVTRVEAIHVEAIHVEAIQVPAPDPVRTEPEPPVDIEFGPLALAETEPAFERRRAAPPSGSLGASATAFVGVFPDPSGGVEIEGALERGWLRWQTGASGWFGGRFRSDQADVGADLWALALATGVCGVPGRRRIRVPLCGVGGVGFMHAEAIGTTAPRQSTQPWAWAGVQARVLILATEQFAVGLGIGAMATLVRPAWEVRAPDVRFRVPPALGVLALTFEARALGLEGRARPKNSALARRSEISRSPGGH